DNDGHMRALPRARDQWQHGIYYHLAYFSTSTRLTKQVAHTITPARVEEEFRQIVKAGATQYMLVNVSELREYVMEARMLAELCWDATKAFAAPDAAARYVAWWSREYFGDAAAGDVEQAYRGYYRLLHSWDQISVGSNAVLQALGALEAKFAGRPVTPTVSDLAPSLEERSRAYKALLNTVTSAAAKLTADRQQYFFEHVSLPLLIDSRQTT